MPILDHDHLKIIKVTFGFSGIWSTHQNQFIPLIPSGDKAFKNSETRVAKHILTTPTPIFFNQLLISMNLYEFKNPTIWLAKSILAHISGTRFFLSMGFVQEYSN